MLSISTSSIYFLLLSLTLIVFHADAKVVSVTNPTFNFQVTATSGTPTQAPSSQMLWQMSSNLGLDATEANPSYTLNFLRTFEVTGSSASNYQIDPQSILDNNNKWSASSVTSNSVNSSFNFGMSPSSSSSSSRFSSLGFSLDVPKAPKSDNGDILMASFATSIQGYQWISSDPSSRLGIVYQFQGLNVPLDQYEAGISIYNDSNVAFANSSLYFPLSATEVQSGNSLKVELHKATDFDPSADVWSLVLLIEHFAEDLLHDACECHHGHCRHHWHNWWTWSPSYSHTHSHSYSYSHSYSHTYSPSWSQSYSYNHTTTTKIIEISVGATGGVLILLALTVIFLVFFLRYKYPGSVEVSVRRI